MQALYTLLYVHCILDAQYIFHSGDKNEELK